MPIGNTDGVDTVDHLVMQLFQENLCTLKRHETLTKMSNMDVSVPGSQNREILRFGLIFTPVFSKSELRQKNALGKIITKHYCELQESSSLDLNDGGNKLFIYLSRT